MRLNRICPSKPPKMKLSLPWIQNVQKLLIKLGAIVKHENTAVNIINLLKSSCSEISLKVVRDHKQFRDEVTKAVSWTRPQENVHHEYGEDGSRTYNNKGETMNKITVIARCVKHFKDGKVKNKTGTCSCDHEGAIGRNKPLSRTSLLKGDAMETVSDDTVKGNKPLLKPDDQLNLSESELKEEITRTLTTANPLAPTNLVEYSYQKGTFITTDATSATVVLIHLDGCVDLKEIPDESSLIGTGDWGDDRSQRKYDSHEESEGEEDGEKKEKSGEECEGTREQTPDPEVVLEEEPVVDEGERGEEEDGEGDAMTSASVKSKKKLINAFNYCDRASLTSINTTRDVFTQTIPPPRETFSELVTQWIIFDAYATDYERQQKEREKDKKAGPPQPLAREGRREEKKRHDKMAAEVQQKTRSAATILDRMLCQNIFDEVSQDYRYYEDPSDEYRQEEGTLLPLWKFSYEKTKKNSVTDISWNPLYYDLFAVTFGTFEFAKRPVEGAVCLFTLKNPSYPEYIRHTESAAMSVATHPNLPYLIVIGMYDGNVAVYNTHSPDQLPQYQSNSVNNKHWGIVWQVRWGADMQDGEVNFFSVSSDGKVYNWVLMQNELAVTMVIALNLPLDPIDGPDGSPVSVRGCGTTINFHPNHPLIFLVGTEEGSIYKCSTAYSSMFLFKYEAHHMPVHKISYNMFYPDIFLSCSADWRVKIWEDMRSEPLFVFDAGCSVGDVQWSPYSSTVFAAVTADGKCHIFDININKYKAICSQSVISKKRNKLTRLRFNPRMPILVVGDDRGCVTTLKLSPNLRVKPKPPKKQQFFDPRQLELMKLEKLLALVREPTNSSIQNDTESVKTD